MKKCCSIVFLVIFGIVFSQIVRIPDQNFKRQIISLGYDTNDDGQIQWSEVQKVKQLYINNLDIVNLEGINSFSNLEELGCYQNKITALDISKLKKLKYLYASGNRISSLNMSGLSELEDLSIEGNLLTAQLDISNLKKLKNLNFSNNRISFINASGLEKLESIKGENNRLEKIELRNNPNLKLIDLKNNPLKITVDIRGLTQLQFFDCTGCNLLFINFSGTVNLKEYYW